jgi:predicted amidohydrolase YtcJ
VPSIDEISDLSKKGIKTGTGDNWLRWGRVKIFADGSLGAETAALREPYQNSNNTGVLIRSPNELESMVQFADDKKWQIETHVIGDKAAEIAINAYDYIKGSDSRPVLTHCQVVDSDLLKRMASKKIIANIQPIFVNSDQLWAEERLGKERMKYGYAWKTIIDSGVICAGGSDAPIEPPAPIYGIHAAVNRQNLKKQPPNGWYPQEKLSIWESISLWTRNAAYAEYMEKEKGMLLSGMLADFVVLDKDPFQIKPENILEISVLATGIGGTLVYKG